MQSLFSEREHGPIAAVSTELTERAWGGLVALISTLSSNGAFGLSFPERCPDGTAIVGTQFYEMSLAICAEIPGLEWPLRADRLTDVATAMDVLEFADAHVAQPIAGSYHSFFQHSHLNFDRAEGQRNFRERVNRIFARNGLRYRLSDIGLIERTVPTPLGPLLARSFPSTHDSVLDELLIDAMRQFADPNSSVRRDGLEKLWDAWERLKTLAVGDKKASTKAVLDAAAVEIEFRALLEAEAKELTRIGNKFRIRHSEASQTVIVEDSQIDYLFFRLAALLWLVISAVSE